MEKKPQVEKKKSQYRWFEKIALKYVFQENSFSAIYVKNNNALGEGAAGRKENVFIEKRRMWAIEF